MVYETFDKCMLLIRTWRSRHSFDDNVYPDSRDPTLRDILSEFGVVPQDLEKSMVALAAWREASEEVYQNMSVIAHTIRNLQSKGDFRAHLSNPLFTGMNDPESPMLKEYPTKFEDFEKLLEHIDIILEGKSVDLTQGSIFFGEVGPEMKQELRDIINSDKWERTTQVGTFTFYREKKK